jgi:hypothetical protein
MQAFRKFSVITGVAVAIFVLTAKLSAYSLNNTECNGGGGCWTACEASNGGSSQLIGASQVSECSPAKGYSCSGKNEVVCGVQYTYTSTNCDPTTISNSYYSMSYTCGS